MSPLRSSPFFDIPPTPLGDDASPGPDPADAGPGAQDVGVPQRPWKMRTSDKIGMGTFSVATVSAYLLWSVIQGQDDLRRDVRDVADEQRLYAVTQERLADMQRQMSERVMSQEAQVTARFSDIDGRVSTVRRNQEDTARELRDHDQRLRVIETRAPAPAATP